MNKDIKTKINNYVNDIMESLNYDTVFCDIGEATYDKIEELCKIAPELIKIIERYEESYREIKVNANYRIYDNRNNKTIFKGSHIDCVYYITNIIDENSKDFPHVWIEINE